MNNAQHTCIAGRTYHVCGRITGLVGLSVRGSRQEYVRRHARRWDEMAGYWIENNIHDIYAYIAMSTTDENLEHKD